MRKGIAIAIVALPLLAAGCNKKTTVTPDVADEGTTFEAVLVQKPVINSPARVLLKATAFKMSGDYANNVAVTLNADGTFAYYPAPSDITENSRPVDLGNGWWLNRQGITSNSQFTKYTFEEYSKLKSAPTQDELRDAIIPGARVVEFEQLPFAASEAMDNLNAIKKLLK